MEQAPRLSNEVPAGLSCQPLTRAHVWFSHFRRFTPKPIADALRSIATAYVAPLWQAHQNGFMLSAFRQVAVDRTGAPLPWYTYPCIRALEQCNFHGRDVLEFGVGQSTHWWSARGARVLGLEDDPAWHARISAAELPNVDARLVSGAGPLLAARVKREIGERRFDIVVIDGLDRIAVAPIAVRHLKPGGAIIFDNSRWGGMVEAFAPFALQRVDYYGPCPAVPLQHCTSAFFRDRCFLFEGSNYPRDIN